MYWMSTAEMDDVLYLNWHETRSGYWLGTRGRARGLHTWASLVPLQVFCLCKDVNPGPCPVAAAIFFCVRQRRRKTPDCIPRSVLHCMFMLGYCLCSKISSIIQEAVSQYHGIPEYQHPCKHRFPLLYSATQLSQYLHSPATD